MSQNSTDASEELSIENVIGLIDSVRENRVCGWVRGISGSSKITVELLYDGQIIGLTVANLHRPDIETAEHDGRCGFEIEVDNPEYRDQLRTGRISARARGTDYLLTNKVANTLVQASGRFVGFMDSVRGNLVSGWVRDLVDDKELSVELLHNGVLIASSMANIQRSDLISSGMGHGNYGFKIEIANPAHIKDLRTGRITARVAGYDFLLTNVVANTKPKSIGKRLEDQLINVLTEPILNIECGFTKAEPSEFDLQIAEEIIELASDLPKYDSVSASIWDVHTSKSQAELLQLVRGRDSSKLAAYLVSLPKTSATEGFGQGLTTYRGLQSLDPEKLSRAAIPVKDTLLTIAQYLGILRLETPEQGNWGEILKEDHKTYVNKLTQSLGFNIVPPVIFDGWFGLSTDNGILGRRNLQAFYAVHRLISVVRQLKRAQAPDHSSGSTLDLSQFCSVSLNPVIRGKDIFGL